jgi:hypothetical protein
MGRRLGMKNRDFFKAVSTVSRLSTDCGGGYNKGEAEVV